MKLLNEAQQEQLQQITVYLREVREEKSIPLAEIAEQTRIRLAFLLALESGRFEDLPEPIYVQGFIRRYGDVLGLDGTALAQSFAAYISLIDSDNYSQNLDKKVGFYIPLAVPYMFLLLLSSTGLIYLLNPRFTIQSLAQSQNSYQVRPQKTIPSPVASPSPVVATKTTVNPTVTVTLELQAKSWLQVKVDGKIEFEGILTKGERKTWTAKNKLTVRSSNAGNVLVGINHQKPKPLGNVDQVKEVTFTPEVRS